MTNPKSIAYYSSVFVVMIPQGAPDWLFVAAVAGDLGFHHVVDRPRGVLLGRAHPKDLRAGEADNRCHHGGC
jgi:hypothetical protein